MEHSEGTRSTGRGPFVRFLFGIMVILALTGRLASAAEPVASFDQANRLYEQGKYSEAIAAYQKLLEQKQVSAALYFNLGNAFFKSGHNGQAIACYLLAERLDPRDPDIRANLRFARETVGNKAPVLRGLWKWLNLVSLNELTLAAAAALWIWFCILAAGELRRAWRSALRPYRIFFGIVALLAGVWLGAILQSRLGSSAAVVVTKEAVIRYGPFDEAQSFYTARDGTELVVLDRKDDWFQVSDASKRTGWLTARNIVLLPRS